MVLVLVNGNNPNTKVVSYHIEAFNFFTLGVSCYLWHETLCKEYIFAKSDTFVFRNETQTKISLHTETAITNQFHPYEKPDLVVPLIQQEKESNFSLP